MALTMIEKSEIVKGFISSRNSKINIHLEFYGIEKVKYVYLFNARTKTVRLIYELTKDNLACREQIDNFDCDEYKVLLSNIKLTKRHDKAEIYWLPDNKESYTIEYIEEDITEESKSFEDDNIKDNKKECNKTIEKNSEIACEDIHDKGELIEDNNQVDNDDKTCFESLNDILSKDDNIYFESLEDILSKDDIKKDRDNKSELTIYNISYKEFIDIKSMSYAHITFLTIVELFVRYTKNNKFILCCCRDIETNNITAIGMGIESNEDDTILSQISTFRYMPKTENNNLGYWIYMKNI